LLRPSFATPSTFEDAVRALDLDFNVFMLRDSPAELASKLTDRIKLSAKFLARATGAQHSKALEAVAQALKFPSWHHLSLQLSRPVDLAGEVLPRTWFDSFSGALLLLSKTDPDLAVPEGQLLAFERFGQTLSMLTDAATQGVLDGVCAPMCAGKSWADVRTRSPLQTKIPLYTFVAHPVDETGGYFDWSAACFQLVEELDDEWQGYGEFTRPQQKRARKWVENALAAQPGFLEGGLALAQMQHDAGDTQASSTLDRFIRQAEALIPKGFKGQVEWLHLGNRCYHRMLWLRLKIHHEAGELPAAAKVARKQLKLNPNDNLGVRYVLPLMLLEQGDFKGANRALKRIDDEVGLTASVIKAFVAFSLGDQIRFCRELGAALFSLPWLRLFLRNTPRGLPEGDDGIRGVQPDLETFRDFAWPAYGMVPGLRGACVAFLAEPDVQQAEAELWHYWKSVWGQRDARGAGTREGWNALASSWIERLAGGRC
jgi:hypothetical protein